MLTMTWGILAWVIYGYICWGFYEICSFMFSHSVVGSIIVILVFVCAAVWVMDRHAPLAIGLLGVVLAIVIIVTIVTLLPTSLKILAFFFLLTSYVFNTQ